jgi:hypothetical protein
MQNSSIKPGYKTSEAWVSLLSSIFVMVSLLAVYTVGRSIVKSVTGRN